MPTSNKRRRLSGIVCHQAAQMTDSLRTKKLLNSESAVELQCDEIQYKLSTFISSLKNAQENILQTDTEEHVSPIKPDEWCTVGADHPAGTMKLSTSPQEELGKGRKKMAFALKEIAGLTSRELYFVN